jgi:lipoprotein-anchoring transpeptidase ErfK/SrfK
MPIALLFALHFATQGTVVSGPLNMAASTQKKILVVRIGPTVVRQYNIAVGTKAHPTPNGRFAVKHVVWNPGWVPPKVKWAKGKKPAQPGDPKNPMRVVKIFFQEPDYYIHGTDQPDSIGEAASHGCIRMTAEDAFALGKYLMDHTGVKKSADWYKEVLSGDESADVFLGGAIPFAIGK